MGVRENVALLLASCALLQFVVDVCSRQRTASDGPQQCKRRLAMLGGSALAAGCAAVVQAWGEGGNGSESSKVLFDGVASASCAVGAFLLLFRARRGIADTSSFPFLFVLPPGCFSVALWDVVSRPRGAGSWLSEDVYYDLADILLIVAGIASAPVFLVRQPQLPNTSTEAPTLLELDHPACDPLLQSSQSCSSWPYITAPPTAKMPFLALTWSWMTESIAAASTRSLVLQDIAPLHPADKSCSSAKLHETEWSKELAKAPGTRSLLRSTWNSVSGELVKAWLLQLVALAAKLGHPLLLNRLLLWLKLSDANGISSGFWLAGALAAAKFIDCFSSHYFDWAQQYVGTKVHTGLCSALYRKALRVQPAKKDGLESADTGGNSSGSMTNFFSVDLHNIRESFADLHFVWSAPLIVLVTLLLLLRFLRWAALSGILVMLIALGAAALLAKILRKRQCLLLAAREERMKLTQEVLGGIRLVKMNAWNTQFLRRIDELRENELRILKGVNFVKMCNTVVTSISMTFMWLASFATYCFFRNTLDAPTAFTVIALFHVVEVPMQEFPEALGKLVQASASLFRIQKFLEQPEVPSLGREYLRAEDSFPVVLKEASIAWPSGESLLERISFSVSLGQFLAVVGPTGSGKSGLLQGLMGDLPPLTGVLSVKGRIAYCAQSAWIQNATVRDNILFGKVFEEKLYRRVIDSCALGRDLLHFPSGDLTEIGERGISLSGGQKQRVALARAVYAGADVYLLDDVLSAVDFNVASTILEKCVLGLLREKCVIMCTHQRFVAKRADKVLFLTRDKSALLGNFCEHTKDASFQALWATEDGGEDSAISPGEASGDKNPADSKSSDLERDAAKVAPMHSDVANERARAMIEKERLRSGGISDDVWMAYFHASGGWMFVVSLSVLIIQVKSFSIGNDAWLAHWSTPSNRVAPKNGLLINAALSVALAVSNLLCLSFVLRGSLKASRHFHNILLRKMLRAPVSFFDVTPIGRILQRLGSDMAVLDNWTMWDYYLSAIFTYASILSLGVVIYVTPFVGLGVVPCVLAFKRTSDLYVVAARQGRRLGSILAAPLLGNLAESIAGASTIRASRSEGFFVGNFEHQLDDRLRAELFTMASNRWQAVRLELVGSCIFVAACFLVVVAGRNVAPGLAGLSISNCVVVSASVASVVRMLSLAEIGTVCVERINDYANETQEEAPDRIPQTKPPEGWPSEGVISFESVTMGYREDLPSVLNGVTFAVEKNQKVAIVGRTGAGKSSIANAFLRLCELRAGRIVVDGVDLAQIGLAELRGGVSIIPQDPLLFTGTLRYNVDPFGKYGDNSVWSALRRARLAGFAEALTDGLDTQIEEGGRNVSMGQRQLLCLARALLRDAKILILDEATSAVDPQTDAFIQDTIRQEFSACSVLTIAHRVNTVLDYDKVVVLRDGKVVAMGSPKVVLRELCEEVEPKVISDRLDI